MARQRQAYQTRPSYLRAITQTFWAYADQHHVGELDGGKRDQRPPVLAKQHASKNVLVPPDSVRAQDIRTAIPINQRHQWFHSLKSSQALAQSVFAAILVFNRLDLLGGITAECGRPAFFNEQRDWKMNFEYELRGLNEPRPTSVDVLLNQPGRRVAIECKFTEQDFGTCSRTKLCQDNANYCNGSYQLQKDRSHRCALAEREILYWEYLPHLFNWQSQRDQVPCPFDDTYQLARSALAATLAPEGKLNPTRGHVLAIYDNRNPDFQPNGKAWTQWQAAISDCRYQGLFRRLSWQRLLTFLADAPEMSYLVYGLREKYGLEQQ